MRRLAGVLLGMLVLAPVASASRPSDSFISVGIFGPAGHHIADFVAPARFSGSVVVDFHGDPATCGSAGTCAMSGVTTWTPPSRTDVDLMEYSVRRKRFAAGIVESPAQVSSSVRVGSGATCADSDAGDFGGPSLGGPVGALRFDLGAQLVTRCGGPLGLDLADAFARPSVSLSRLRRAPATIGLRGTHAFRAHGLVGTVRSTVTLHVSRVRIRKQPEIPGGPRIVLRERYLQISYRVVSIAGGVTASLRGDPASCAFLGACGITGTLNVQPRPVAPRATVTASASAKHSTRELRVALGLASGPRPHGVLVAGGVSWTHDHGAVRETWAAGSGPACTDEGPLGQADVGVFSNGGIVGAHLIEAGGGRSALVPVRTRCPGPQLGVAFGTYSIAAGRLPPGALGRRTVTIHLDRAPAIGDDGYTGDAHADMTIVLRRTKVRERVVVQRFPNG